MIPDLSTLKKLPWNKEPTAQVICDLHSNSGCTFSYCSETSLNENN